MKLHVFGVFKEIVAWHGMAWQHMAWHGMAWKDVHDALQCSKLALLKR